MKHKGKIYKVCKSAFYLWGYQSSCILKLRQAGVSKRVFKKWYFKHMAFVYPQEYIQVCWKESINQIG